MAAFFVMFNLIYLFSFLFGNWKAKFISGFDFIYISLANSEQRIIEFIFLSFNN